MVSVRKSPRLSQPKTSLTVESPLVSVFEYPAFSRTTPAVYRTSILLIIQQITSKNPASPGTSFMFHYALRGCLRCIHTRRDWNSLESVRTSEKT